MKLTKDQRYTAYCIMLEEAENQSKTNDGFNSTNHGICYMVSEIFELDTYVEDDFMQNFPELHDKKTIKEDDWYWHNWEERIAALKQCIKETENF